MLARKQISLLKEIKINSLFHLLKGLALDYFYSNLEDQEHLSFEDVCKDYPKPL